MSNESEPTARDWSLAIGGDRDAFERAVAHVESELLADAHREVAHLVSNGEMRPDQLTPEELVGETLLRAWDLRTRFPEKRMTMRAWLLGLQHRSLVRVLRQERLYSDRKAISLSDEIPVRPEDDHVEEGLYEFNQPFDVTTYAELLAGSAPEDVEIDFDKHGYPSNEHSLTDKERAAIDTATLEGRLDDTSRRAVLLHDEFALDLSEVAQILDYSLKDTAEAVNMARTRLRDYLGDSREDG